MAVARIGALVEITMSSRRINSLLWTCATALLALAVGAIVWTVVNPVEHDSIARPTGANNPTTNPASAAGLPSLASMQAILDKPLRWNLTGEPTTDARAAVANSNDPPLTLVGTIGNSLAMLKTRDGKIELKGVGETVAGMTVVSISASRIQVRYNGRLISLDKT